MGGCSCPSHFLVSTSFIVLLWRRSLQPVASHIGTCGILETGVSLNFVSYCPKSFFFFFPFLFPETRGVSLLLSTEKPPLLIYSPHPLGPQRLMSSHLKFSCKKKQKANCLSEAYINPDSKAPFRHLSHPSNRAVQSWALSSGSSQQNGLLNFAGKYYLVYKTYPSLIFPFSL